MTITGPGAPGWQERPYRRIAAEEAFAPAVMFDDYRDVLAGTDVDQGFESLMGYFLTSSHPQPRAVIDRITGLGEARIADMDATGIDHQILSLTSPGTQVLPADRARAIATLSNDVLSDAISRHPSRLSGLAAVAFDDIDAAIKELERGVRDLGLKGLIVNSHIKGTYLDAPNYRPLLEAVADLDVPLYLHPQTLPGNVVGPYREAGLDGAVWGFAAETGLHLLRIITSGTFDRIPNLRVVVGHLGEGVPFFMNRIDHMHAKQVASGRYEAIKPLEQRPSEYLRSHIWLTSSGMPWEPAISFARSVVGADRVMYAMDYPYQFEASEVNAMDALPFTDAEKFDFFEGTATRVFGL